MALSLNNVLGSDLLKLIIICQSSPVQCCSGKNLSKCQHLVDDFMSLYDLRIVGYRLIDLAKLLGIDEALQWNIYPVVTKHKPHVVI